MNVRSTILSIALMLVSVFATAGSLTTGHRVSASCSTSRWDHRYAYFEVIGVEGRSFYPTFGSLEECETERSELTDGSKARICGCENFINRTEIVKTLGLYPVTKDVLFCYSLNTDGSVEKTKVAEFKNRWNNNLYDCELNRTKLLGERESR